MKPRCPAPMRLRAPVLLIGLTLVGCARDRDTTPYPSLAVRPVEKQGFAEPPAKPVVIHPDPALDARIADMTTRFHAVEQEFAKAYDQARASAAKARGDAVGSVAWLNAQSDLAVLDDIRARTSTLLSDIDQDAMARANALEPAYPALTALRGRVVGLATRQQEQIRTLSDSLPAA